MKRLILLLLVLIPIGLFGQIQTNHFFGSISASDLKADQVKISKAKGFVDNMTVYLRPVISETAYEIPLKKGMQGQFFNATGIGLSLAGYYLKDGVATERGALNALLFANNETGEFSSVALTLGVPIPKLNLPNLNAGLRYDWNLKQFYLQTGISLEF